MSNFSGMIHLLGRYPELAQNNNFQAWLGAYGGATWHDTTATDEGYVTVIVQSDLRLNLFAAVLLRDMSRADAGVIEQKVIRTTNIDLIRQSFSANEAVKTV